MIHEQVNYAFLEAEKEFGTDKAIGLLVGSGKLRNPNLPKSATQLLFEKMLVIQNKE